MSLYAVQNGEGKWLGCEIYCDEPDWFDHGGFIWDTRSIAEENVNLYGGHVVELVDAPAKIVVSEEEAKMLKKAKETTVWRPAAVIAGYASDHERQGDDEVLLEDRLMRAYVNCYTVAKEKKYYVKVPFVQAQGGLWFYINSEDKLDATYLQKMAKKFTMDEIERYGLQNCEKVVCTDSARTTGEED